MARETHLTKDGRKPILVITDELGSRIIDEETGTVISAAYDDRHDEWVQQYVRGGWVIVSETDADSAPGHFRLLAAAADEHVAAFGRGFYSLGSYGVQDVCIRDQIVPDPINEVSSSLHLVTNSYDRSEAFKLDIQASYKAFGAGGSASASFSRSLDISSKSISLVLRKIITTTKLRILNPTVTEGAKLFLDQYGPQEFLERYGDVCVTEAIFGAALFITFHSEAESVRKAQEMRRAISGKAGPVSGSLSSSQSIFEKVAKEELFLDSYSVGALDAPPTGKFRADDDAKLNDLLNYFDSFEEKIKGESGGIGALREFSFMPIAMLNGIAPNSTVDFGPQWDALKQATNLRENIRQTRAIFDDAVEQPANEAARAQMEEGIERLERMDEDLEEFGDALIRDPIHAPTDLTLSTADLPNLPEFGSPILDVRFSAVFVDSEPHTQQGQNGEMLSGALKSNGYREMLTDFYGEVGALDPPNVIMAGSLFHLGDQPATFSKSLWAREPYKWRWLQRMYIEGVGAEHYSIAYKLQYFGGGEKEVSETPWLKDGEDVVLPANHYACGIAIRLLPRYGLELPRE